jgi:hypothetical protein
MPAWVKSLRQHSVLILAQHSMFSISLNSVVLIATPTCERQTLGSVG